MRKIKITLLVLLTFLLTLDSSARHRMSVRHSWDGSLRTGIHIGVSGSFNSTWILNQNNYGTLARFTTPIVRQSEMDYVFTWGGQVGVSIGYNFRKQWGIQFEPSFSWAGQKYDDNFSGPVDAKLNPDGITWANPDGTAITTTSPAKSPYASTGYGYVNVHREVHFTYIQLPLYAKYQTHIGDIANYYVMLGPQVNVRMSGTESIYVKHIFDEVATNRFTPDQKFKKIDVGMSLNTGVEIYATTWFYINIGIVAFGSFTDLNGSDLKNLTADWYSKNDVDYQSSHNFYLGLHTGLHFYLDRPQYY